MTHEEAKRKNWYFLSPKSGVPVEKPSIHELVHSICCPDSYKYFLIRGGRLWRRKISRMRWSLVGLIIVSLGEWSEEVSHSPEIWEVIRLGSRGGSGNDWTNLWQNDFGRRIREKKKSMQTGSDCRFKPHGVYVLLEGKEFSNSGNF